MAEYYVIRDKNTGLYFRGKGVNRWGKYYNQASIYRIKANAENTVKEVSWRGEQAEIVPIQIIETTADVVPRREVEETFEEIENLKKKLAETEAELMNVCLEKTNCDEMIQYILDFYFRQKVTEVFEEIETEIENALKSNYSVLPQIEESKAIWNRVNGKIDALRGIEGFIEELKEKYTEDET